MFRRDNRNTRRDSKKGQKRDTVGARPAGGSSSPIGSTSSEGFASDGQRGQAEWPEIGGLPVPRLSRSPCPTHLPSRDELRAADVRRVDAAEKDAPDIRCRRQRRDAALQRWPSGQVKSAQKVDEEEEERLRRRTQQMEEARAAGRRGGEGGIQGIPPMEELHRTGLALRRGTGPSNGDYTDSHCSLKVCTGGARSRRKELVLSGGEEVEHMVTCSDHSFTERSMPASPEKEDSEETRRQSRSLETLRARALPRSRSRRRGEGTKGRGEGTKQPCSPERRKGRGEGTKGRGEGTKQPRSPERRKLRARLRAPADARSCERDSVSSSRGRARPAQYPYALSRCESYEQLFRQCEDRVSIACGYAGGGEEVRRRFCMEELEFRERMLPGRREIMERCRTKVKEAEKQWRHCIGRFEDAEARVQQTKREIRAFTALGLHGTLEEALSRRTSWERP